MPTHDPTPFAPGGRPVPESIGIRLESARCRPPKERSTYWSEVQPAAADEHFTSHVVGKRGTEEQHGARCFLGSSRASQRALGLYRLEQLGLHSHRDLPALNLDVCRST